MNRRDFLKRLLASASGVAIAATFDVDRLLWVPGERTIFLPPEDEFIGNTFITPSWVTRELANVFLNNLKTAKLFERQWDTSMSVGEIVSVTLPRHFQFGVA